MSTIKNEFSGRTSVMSDLEPFSKESNLSQIIGNEELLFTDKINKINRYGMTQERNILITNKAVYNLKKKGKYIFLIIDYILNKKKQREEFL